MRLLFVSCLLLAGCGATHAPYHLILVEKQKKLYDLETGNACEVSGYDINPKYYKEDNKEEAELVITYSNCNVKEHVILDDKQKVLWGMRPQPETKKGMPQ